MAWSRFTSTILCTILVIGHFSSRIFSSYPETLEECERLGKQFCYTGIAPNRHDINTAIKNDPKLMAIYHQSRWSIGKYEEEMIRRNKREASTDCSSVCCVTTDSTPPYSFYRDHDGWHEVATTPEFPLRVTFFTEKCTNLNSPCRGVKSADSDYQPRCEQVQFRHALLVYNRTLGGVQTRYVTVPSGCTCKLLLRNPFKESTSVTGG